MNPNADMEQGKKKAYGCRVAAEVRHRSLDRFRSMQRPRSMKMRGRRWRSSSSSRVREEEDAEWRRMRKDLVGSIYKEN